MQTPGPSVVASIDPSRDGGLLLHSTTSGKWDDVATTCPPEPVLLDGCRGRTEPRTSTPRLGVGTTVELFGRRHPLAE